MLININPLLYSKEYRLLFIGQTISYIGNMITYVAIPYEIYAITKSSFLVGVLGTAQLIPLLFTALWGGAFADSLNRRRLIITSELILVLCSIMLVVNSVSGTPNVTFLFVLAILMSAITGFHRPAMESLKVQLVRKEDISAIAPLDSLRFSTCAIGGPALAGIIISNFGISTAYAIDACSFFVSLLCLYFLKTSPNTVAQSPVPHSKAIMDGLKYAKSRPELIGTYLVDIIAMIFAMPIALFPAMSQNWGGAQAAGWLYAAMPVGTLTVAIFSGWSQRISRHGAAVIIGATIWGIAVLVLGFADSLPWAVLCLAIAGAGDAISGLYRSTIWNETIPTQMRGRLAGLEMLSYMSGPLLGNTRAGFIASITNVSFSVISGGLLCIVGMLLCVFLLPKFWKYTGKAQT